MRSNRLQMAEIQSVSLEILKKVTDFCDENNIKYFLAYGTLIGAVRHHGYIPWDDDVDIMMGRPDYNRFLKLFREKNDTPYLTLFTQEDNKDYPYVLARISDSRYYIDVKNEKPCGLGIFLDIYPLDGIGHSYSESIKTLKLTTRYPSLIFLATRKYYHFGTTKGFIKRMFKIPAFIYAKLMGKNYFIKKLENIISQFDYNDCEYIGAAMWCTQPLKNSYKKEWCEELIKAKFGKYDFFIPKRYDEILKTTYGDYMQLPPEKDRIYHHLYKAYKK